MGLTKPKSTNIDTSKWVIGDPIIEMNVNLADANANNTDIGFIFKRGTTGDNTALLWDKSAQEFVFAITTATGDSVGDLPITAYSDLQIKNLTSAGLKYPTADGTNGHVLVTDGAGNLSFSSVPASPAAWGVITGTLANQIDLQGELDLKYDDSTTMDAGTY